ncbi:ArsA family ATPase [Glycomyces xiaoerkulensis]|uniref:ArsA family ATPase n=1 Tax=Glycomyces xiaoerkulensis TaxID=2038139 RepID=UPI000C262E43|nr:ArsA-related P-loop ATPase [Glycomyces xiaoerkulensis]
MRSDLDVDRLLADDGKHVIACCGSGGVGKTTTAAALALRAAERHGRRTVVLTIDPARRLAQSLGMEALDNTPRPVEGPEAGSLDAMMLDMKRTFDDVVASHTTPERAAEIFANPFYEAVSSTFSGTQEYMAMEKLGQLRETGRWDLIVLDTPPSRSALDFLDAPARLARFLDGRVIRLLSASTPGSRRSMLSVMGASAAVFTRVFNKILGGHLLTDVAEFTASLEDTFGGFRRRAEATFRALQDDQTSFLVVATPEPAAINEAMYFSRRLTEERMPLDGMVLNQLTPVRASMSAERCLGAAASLEEGDPDSPVAAVLRTHADLARRRAAEERVAARYGAACPEIPQVWLPKAGAEVVDLAGLRAFAGRAVRRDGED